jgi:hypothetical protein
MKNWLEATATVKINDLQQREKTTFTKAARPKIPRGGAITSINA